MTKLDEIIWNTPIPVMVDEVEARYPIETIKEIAIEYAKLCLEKAAEEAKAIKVHLWENVKDVDDEFECGDYEIKVFKKSITNIKLP